MNVQMFYFLLIDSPKGVIELLDKVHRLINVEKAKNVEQCLKFVRRQDIRWTGSEVYTISTWPM